MSEPSITIKTADFSTLRALMLKRMDKLTRIGWIDYSPLSPDWSQASARAYRVQQRIQFNRRLTRAEWRKELGLF